MKKKYVKEQRLSTSTPSETQHDWKIIEKDGSVLLKVIDFPAYRSGMAGESMWIERVCGDDFNGTGTLRNNPVGSDLKYGDLIFYADGTTETKPSYAGSGRVDDESNSLVIELWSQNERQTFRLT